MLPLAAQDENRFQEDQIEELCFGVLNANQDEERKQFNQALKRVLKESLEEVGSFDYAFPKVKSLGILTSPDSNLRLFNWMVPYSNGTYDYECFAQVRFKNEVRLIVLKNLNEDSILSEKSSYTADQWPGALYYELIEKKNQFSTYYTLLGWDGHNRLTNRKIIEVMRIKSNGTLSFGARIFKSNRPNSQQRILFTYGDQNRMKLSYDETQDWIVFDHLSPPSSNLEGIYEYYGADFSFDAYKWEKSYWRHFSDVDIDQGLQKKKRDFKVDKNEILVEPDIYNEKKIREKPSTSP